MVTMLWIAVVGWQAFYSFPLQFSNLSGQWSGGGGLVCANMVVVWVVGRLVVDWFLLI